MNNTYNGSALVGSLMECRITEKTTLEITINGEKQEPITVSEKQIDIKYKRTFNKELIISLFLQHRITMEQWELIQAVIIEAD